jgi:hypothetical protein
MLGNTGTSEGRAVMVKGYIGRVIREEVTVASAGPERYPRKGKRLPHPTLAERELKPCIHAHK